jgi:hypothetical protein
MKSFKTLKYEGSQSKVNALVEYNIFGVNGINVTGVLSDHEYYNLNNKPGWRVESIETNKQKGSIDEFIGKEGKWFNYIKGESVVSNAGGSITSGFDTANFAIQGIGMSQASSIISVAGCTCGGSSSCPCCPDGEPAFNFDPNATIDDGSCYPIICGCTDPNADNFITLTGNNQVDINTDFCNNSVVSSCIYYGCTDPTAFNFDPIATVDDGSCIPTVFGCTDPASFNYDPLANVDDGSCVAIYLGCTDNWTVDGCGYGTTGACNYNPLANVDDGSCTYAVYGCTDPLACIFYPLATDDDGSCLYCGDPAADNYDGGFVASGAVCWNSCEYCMIPLNFYADPASATTTTIDLTWDLATWPGNGSAYTSGTYTLTVTDAAGVVAFNGVITPTELNGTMTWVVTGLSAGLWYDFDLHYQCENGGVPVVSTLAATVDIPGCTDNTGVYNTIGSWGACNYDPTATYYDGSCEYSSCVGCTNPLANNYNPAATIDDGSCILPVPGCTDPTAFNYNPNANVDDGSCVPVVMGCTDDQLDNNGFINNDPTSFAATNFDPLANTDDGSCTYNCPILTHDTISNDSYVARVFLMDTYYSLGINYAGNFPDAFKMYITVSDDVTGAVYYNNITPPGVGGFSLSFTNARFDTTLNIFNDFGVPVGTTEIYIETEVYTNDGNCAADKNHVFSIGCNDPAANNVGSFDFTDNSQCTYTGCTDETFDNNGNYAATNYNALAALPGGTTCDNGTGLNDCCTYNNSPTARLLHSDSIISGTDYSLFHALEFDFDTTAHTSAVITAISVETTGQAYNIWQGYYIGGTSIHNGVTSQSYIQHFGGSSNLTLGTGGTYNKDLLPLDFNNFDTTTWVGLEHPTVNTLAHGIGNGDPVNLNIEYTVQWSGTIDNPSRGNMLTGTTYQNQTFTGGCKVGSASQYTNWDPALQLHIPGSCIPLVGGCTDPAAFNYCSTCNADCSDDVGGTDMGCCIAVVDGCTDATAFNYDAAANTDDGSCCLPPCAVPGTLTAYYGGPSSVQLSYTDIPCADYYAIETCAGAGCTWTISGYSTANNQNAPGSFFLDISSIATGIELQIRMNSVCVYDLTGATANSAYTNTVVYNT